MVQSFAFRHCFRSLQLNQMYNNVHGTQEERGQLKYTNEEKTFGHPGDWPSHPQVWLPLYMSRPANLGQEGTSNCSAYTFSPLRVPMPLVMIASTVALQAN